MKLTRTLKFCGCPLRLFSLRVHFFSRDFNLISSQPQPSVFDGWVGPNFQEELPYPIEYIELSCPGLGKYTLDQVRPGRPDQGVIY